MCVLCFFCVCECLFNLLCEFLPVCFVVVCVSSAVLLDFIVCLRFVSDQDRQMIGAQCLHCGPVSISLK